MVALKDRAVMPADVLERREFRNCELVGGQLVEKNISNESVWVGGEVHGRLHDVAVRDDAGGAFPDGHAYQCFSWDAELLRRPEGSFITRRRLSESPPTTGCIGIVPDLVVLVSTTADLYIETDQRVHDFLKAGTSLCWIFGPARPAVTVLRKDGTGLRLRNDDTLSGEDVLPGFRFSVADFFPPADLSTLL